MDIYGCPLLSRGLYHRNEPFGPVAGKESIISLNISLPGLKAQSDSTSFLYISKLSIHTVPGAVKDITIRNFVLSFSSGITKS